MTGSKGCGEDATQNSAYTENNSSIQHTPNQIANSDEIGNNSLRPKSIKIDMSDIEDEIKYWETAVVCFVVGSNPPLHIIDEFIRRIWKDLDIDTVGIVDSGVFLVLLKSIEDIYKAYEANGVLFDNKPFIIKPWRPEMPTDKSSLSTMPVWIQLPKLKMEYWG